MSVLFVNAAAQPVLNQEIVVATLAGPLDNLDAYVKASAWADGFLSFFVYATVGGVRAKVATAIYQGPKAGRLQWIVGTNPIGAPVHAGGSSYDLVVFASATQNSGIGLQPSAPPAITATFAGVNEGDVVADANGSTTVLVGAGETTIRTAPGFNQDADVAANLAGLPALDFRLYASCGLGSVEAVVAEQTTQGSDGFTSIMHGVALSVATSYRLACTLVDPTNPPVNVTASLSTRNASALSDAVVALAQISLASTPIAAGQGFVPSQNGILIANTANLATNLTIGGVALTGGNPGDTIEVIFTGTLPSSLVLLGAGPKTAVGLDVHGNLVRVTDPICTSGLKYVGTCDATGSVYVAPRNETVFRTDDFGAVGDGVADDTIALQAACTRASNNATAKSSGSIVYAIGALLCTAMITIDGAVTIMSDGVVPGGINANVNTYATLIHDFDGDFLHWTGANGVSPTSGGGAERIRIVQKFGAAGDGIPRGRAISVTAVDVNHLPNWMNFRQLVIEEAGNSPWTWAIDIDGSAGGGISNLRFLEVSTHTSLGALGAIRLFSVFSAKLVATECHNTAGHYLFDGTAGIHSVGIQLIGGDGVNVTCDHADQIAIIGGSYHQITTTLNTLAPNNFAPSQLTVPFHDTSGTAFSGAWFFDSSIFGSGVAYWRASKPIALENSEYEAGVNAAGTAVVSIVGLDVDNVIRVGPSGNAPIALGAPTNTHGGAIGNGDLVLGATNIIHFQKHDGSAAVRAMQMSNDASELVYIGLGALGSVLLGGSGFKVWADATGIGFYGTAPITKPAPTGSRGGNAALASLLTALANLGLITDNTSV